MKKILPCLALLIATALLADEKPQNNAIVPTGRLEKDFYDWDQRHEAVLAVKGKVNPDYVLIGDSITHLWAGEPNEPKGNRGADSWKALFGERALNLGFGWDRTQNVLWRIDHGELDGLHPKGIVIHIGTNNLAGTTHARASSPQEIAEAVGLIVDRVHEKCPEAKIILMAVFPRGEKPSDPHRAQIASINKLIAPLAGKPQVTFLDITTKLTNPDGTISKDMMGDFLHPAARGYAVWADALREVLPK